MRMNCPKIHCFYCSKSGHMKVNCWIKKMCYIFSKLKEKEDQKDKRKGKKEKNKEKKKQRRKEFEIINNRVQYMVTYLKKSEKGKEKYFVKWKDVELGQYIGTNSPAQTISNFLEHKYEDKYLFVLIKRNTLLDRFTLYNGLSNWCACDEIDLGKDIFCKHVKLKHNGMIPMNS